MKANFAGRVIFATVMFFCAYHSESRIRPGKGSNRKGSKDLLKEIGLWGIGKNKKK